MCVATVGVSVIRLLVFCGDLATVIVQFAMLVLSVSYTSNYVGHLDQPYQGYVIGGALVLNLCFGVSFLVLFVWKPKRIEKMCKSIKI